jgi:hypothetical protein
LNRRDQPLHPSRHALAAIDRFSPGNREQPGPERRVPAKSVELLEGQSRTPPAPRRPPRWPATAARAARNTARRFRSTSSPKASTSRPRARRTRSRSAGSAVASVAVTRSIEA